MGVGVQEGGGKYYYIAVSISDFRATNGTRLSKKS